MCSHIFSNQNRTFTFVRISLTSIIKRCNNMVLKLYPETRAYGRLLLKEGKLSIREISERIGVSKSSVQRLRNCNFNQPPPTPAPKTGRPQKLTTREKRHILRSVHHLRRTQGTFTSGRVMEDAGISKANVSGRTVTRFLNNEGYYFMNARQKGILSPQDLRKWVMYAKKIKGTSGGTYPLTIWTEGIAFYLDGVNFVYKTKPKDQAVAPQKKGVAQEIWRIKARVRC